MAIIDAKGRLFGKFSILDVGAALIILMVIIGIVIVPGEGGQSIADSGNTKPVELDTLVLGLNVRDPNKLFKDGDTTHFIIRNQPYGQVKIKKIETLPRSFAFGLPNGTVKILDEPRLESQFSRNMLITLEGEGRDTSKGPLLGNVPIKIGTPVELEGRLYTFRASVVDVRVGE